MTTILGAAASGLQHHSRMIEAVGHNVANVNTTGFKKTRPLGEGVPSTLSQPGEPRMGVALTTFDVIHTLGPALNTGDPMHFAIQDESFFRVTLEDGSTAYTRAGALNVDAEGNILAYGGLVLDPPVTIPADATQPAIDNSGVITALDANGDRQQYGQLTLVRFVNPQGLQQIGEGLYRETENSGELTEGTPGDGNFEVVITGALEGSNVNLAEEFTTMIIAQRAYQAAAKTFSVGDDMLQIATNLTR